MERMVLASSGYPDDAISIGDMNIRRCRGCAKCMYENPGSCVLDDNFSKIIPDILSIDEVEIHSELDNHWFAMPMRKAVERIGNILEAWTDSGNNDPRDHSEITIRKILIVTNGPEDERFESSSKEVLQKGPVEVSFKYI